VRHIELTLLPGVVIKRRANYFQLNQLATGSLPCCEYCVARVTVLYCNAVNGPTGLSLVV
jgi:hypothetical protein